MAKLFLKKLNKQHDTKDEQHDTKDLSNDEIKTQLRKKHACYVLITCSEPSEEGKMDVELTYDGDESLASYLLQSAQGIFDEHLDQSIDSYQK